MQRFYQIDLRQALWGSDQISHRRLATLIRHLPPEAALNRQATQGTTWTMDTEIATITLELIHELYRLTAKAAGVDNSDLPDELRITRPWTPPPKPTRRRAATANEVAALFGTTIGA